MGFYGNRFNQAVALLFLFYAGLYPFENSRSVEVRAHQEVNSLDHAISPASTKGGLPQTQTTPIPVDEDWPNGQPKTRTTKDETAPPRDSWTVKEYDQQGFLKTVTKITLTYTALNKPQRETVRKFGPDGSLINDTVTDFDRGGFRQQTGTTEFDGEGQVTKTTTTYYDGEGKPTRKRGRGPDGPFNEKWKPDPDHPQGGTWEPIKPTTQRTSAVTSTIAQPGFNAINTVAGGLRTTTFTTPQGRIYVNLTDDIIAGDTFSGTLIAEPGGQNDQDRTQNQGELTRYVIELDGQQTPASNSTFKRGIPTAPTPYAISLILKDKQGQEVAEAELPVLASSPAPVEDFLIPTIGQQGRPIEIRGPFDGDFTSTGVKIGGDAIHVLAESLRKVVARNTSPKVGLTKIEVQEQGQTVEAECRNLSLRLSAPKLNLLRGEQTTLTVAVSGLEGIQEAVPLLLKNESPSIISMGGGDAQNITISPAQVQRGDYTTERPLTGVQPGAFSIVATVTAKKDLIVKGKKRGGVTKIPTGGPSIPKEPAPKEPTPKGPIPKEPGQKQVTTSQERTQQILEEINREFKVALVHLQNGDATLTRNSLLRAEKLAGDMLFGGPFSTTEVLGIPVQDWASFFDELDRELSQLINMFRPGFLTKERKSDILRRIVDIRSLIYTFESRLPADGGPQVTRAKELLNRIRNHLDRVFLEPDPDFEPPIEDRAAWAMRELGLAEGVKVQMFTLEPFTRNRIYGIPVSEWLGFKHDYDKALGDALEAIGPDTRIGDPDRAKRVIERIMERKHGIEDALRSPISSTAPRPKENFAGEYCKTLIFEPESGSQLRDVNSTDRTCVTAAIESGGKIMVSYHCRNNRAPCTADLELLYITGVVRTVTINCTPGK